MTWRAMRTRPHHHGDGVLCLAELRDAQLGLNLEHVRATKAQSVRTDA